LAILPAILAILHRLTMKDNADRELAIFTEAIKVPIQERTAFLDIACNGDEPLRRKVEALLKAYDRVGNFLEEPPGRETVG
jgi:eukaryotic-like serine/threonine-protein kinase